MNDCKGKPYGSKGMTEYGSSLRSLGYETIITSWELIKITVPVVITTKILEELGLISHLSNILEPVMLLVGLPGVLGIVWATAIITNLYAAMAVFAELAPGLHLSIGQTTILCSLMLVAHSLPLELSISKKAGAGFAAMGLLRLTGALCLGVILNAFCSFSSYMQEPADMLLKGGHKVATVLGWGVEQARNLILLVVVIFAILVIMRLLKVIGVLSLLERSLAPILPLLGMSRKAAPLTVVGMVMGISYGGALIIREAHSGHLKRAEIFNSLALMGLSHSLVEDTLLMMAMGGSLIGILWGRLLFSLIVIFFLVRCMRSRWDKFSNEGHGCIP